MFRELFFGSENSNNYLKIISQSSIIFILKIKGATIGKNSVIQSGITLHNAKNFSNLKIGNNCHIGKNCFFDLREEVLIGNNVVIGMQNTFITHLDMTNSSLSYYYPAKKLPIIINDNVYIGANCTILMGVIIEDSAFIASNALINKNVKSFTIVGGIPAKEIKKINGI
ncbi:hypothetical protein BTO13_00210 [Polaribacter gangjinensis]|uniref:Transferase n=1 Tax=Polaribacter gangjinensis TaxID=574710 RepID=A0A2S7W840_9FLAO|nr:hypothetical protein BTO13_00210 [Polaribacter gangjinensis]